MKKSIVLVVTFTAVLAAFPAQADYWEGDSDSMDRRHSVWTRFGDDGAALLEIATYDHGVRTGATDTYYESGNPHTSTMYRDDNREGVYREYFDQNGSPDRKQGNFKNGLQDGEWTSWHPNGQLESIENFFNGERDGISSTFFASGDGERGRGWVEAHYKDGLLHGDYFSSFDNSENSPQLIGQHNNNERTGFWVEYAANGKLVSQLNYVAGKKHGDAKLGHASGQLYVESFYDQDLLHGEYIEYYDNSEHTIRYRGSHREELRDGDWKEWSTNGILISETRYHLGLLTGSASYYNEFDGSLGYIAEYENGQLHGGYIEYFFPKPIQDFAISESVISESGPDENNYRKEFGKYVEGARDGEWYFLHGNGETRIHGDYFMGQLSGKWRDYNLDGELTRIREYSDNELINEIVDCNLTTVRCDDD